MLKYLILTTVLLISLFVVIIRSYYIKKWTKNRELLKKLTEREEKYRELAEMYETVVSNIREVIFQLSPDGDLLFMNNSWEKLTGYSIAESVGKKLVDFLSPEEMKGFHTDIQSKVLTNEIYMMTRNGQRKMIEFTMIPLFSKEDEMYGYSGSINDVTERKEQEGYIRESKRYVEKLNFELEKRVQEEVCKNRQKDHMLIEQSRLAAMGEMIASIGHQWRQPLNNLSLIIQDVSEAMEFGEINNKYITRFTAESMILIKHMSRTINDFRKFYLPNKERTSFSIAESIEHSLSIFSISLKSHHINVQFVYRGQQRVFGFQNEFSQAVLNILTNARDAFVEHEVENRLIRIKINENKLYYTATITDNAGGISPVLTDKIFDPYFTTRPNGTGLGLYMTKMILENMDGNIKVENTTDGFQVHLSVPKGQPAGVQESA